MQGHLEMLQSLEADGFRRKKQAFRILSAMPSDWLHAEEPNPRSISFDAANPSPGFHTEHSRAWYLKHLRLLSFDKSEMALSSILPASLIVVAPGSDKIDLREVEMGAM